MASNGLTLEPAAWVLSPSSTAPGGAAGTLFDLFFSLICESGYRLPQDHQEGGISNYVNGSEQHWAQKVITV